MANTTPVAVTITAHPTHWYDWVAKILAAINAANPIIATIIPAPVEAGIQIGTQLAPIVVGTIQSITDPASVTPPAA